MKTIFWNVDTQYDFMKKEGALYVQGAESIEGNLEKLTDLAREKVIQVVNTADWHTKDSKELSDKPDFKTTFPEHCMIGTKGAKYIPATSTDNFRNPTGPYIIDWRDEKIDVQNLIRRNIILYKDDFDVFKGNPYTEKVLEKIKPDRVIVYGVATNVCVNYAVLGLLERKIEVYVPLDAIKELPGLPLGDVLNKWKDKGAILTTTKEIIDLCK